MIDVPAILSGGCFTISANRELAYRIIPVRERVSAPSRIFSTSTRYGVIGTFERVDLPGFAVCDDDGIHFTGTDCVERLFELADLLAQTLPLPFRRSPFVWFRAARGTRVLCHKYRLRPWYEVEADEHLSFRVMSPITFRSGSGQFLDERRRREHEVDRVLRPVLVDVDDVELVPPFEVLLADLLDVLDRQAATGGCCPQCRAGGRSARSSAVRALLRTRRSRRPWLLRGSVASPLLLLHRRFCLCRLRFLRRAAMSLDLPQVEAHEHLLGVREVPDDLLDRVGSFRIRVGTAMIWWSFASCGFLMRSMTSILYRQSRCSAQIFLRLSNAVTEFRVCPATYSRRIHSSPSGSSDFFSAISFRVGFRCRGHAVTSGC